jgi:hypothetical protein
VQERYRGYEYTRNNKKLVGCVFCAVRVVSKESRLLVLTRTCCLFTCSAQEPAANYRVSINTKQTTINEAQEQTSQAKSTESVIFITFQCGFLRISVDLETSAAEEALLAEGQWLEAELNMQHTSNDINIELPVMTRARGNPPRCFLIQLEDIPTERSRTEYYGGSTHRIYRVSNTDFLGFRHSQLIPF